MHHHHAESFYVLDGELELTVADHALRAAAGAWLHVPPGVPHGEPSCGPGPARFLDLHAPGLGLGTLDREPAAV